MGSKRAADDDGHQPATEKRQRPSTAAASPYASRRSAQAPDLTYGQRAAFGDLGDATVPTGDDLEWEDETDALAYLRSVRQEARGIPNVLAASRDPQLEADRSIYDNGRGDFRGYYHDGAYVAFPEGYEYDGDDGDGEEGGEEEEAEDDDDDGEGDEDDSEATSPDRPRNSNSAEIHEAYFASLTAQYEALRRFLHTAPPGRVVAALPREHTPEVGNFAASAVTFKQWAGRMSNTDPRPAQVAAMHKDGVVRLLRILLGGNFFRKGHVLRERTSRWLWALLARLPSRGELDYQEIGCVRELGKRAVLSMVSLAEAEILEREYDVGGGNAAGDNDDAAADDADGEAPDVVDHKGDRAPADEEIRPDSSVENSVDQGPKAPLERTQSPSAHHVAGDAAAAAQAPAQTSDEAASPPDVEMQDDSDMEDEGEVSADPPPPQREPPADLETAKLQLLAQLNGDKDKPGPDALGDTGDTGAAVEQTPEPVEESPEERAKANVRATLNMILTVAGEFYGQRDLLEFRDPFGRVLEEGG